MKMSLYVVTHKEIETRYFVDRKIMFVGANGKTVPSGYYTDFNENLDNISNKNKNYCELTGLYYMVQNDQSDIFSLEHYRRIFVKKRFYLFKYPIYNKKNIEKLMKEFDIILPYKSKFEKSILEEYAESHYKEDFEKIREIIKKDHSNYLDAFDKVMSGHETYLLNMFIGKSEIIKDYSNWLFDILFKLESMIDISDRDDYQKRVFGFLSERLFTVYILNHPEIKVKHSRVQMIYQNPIKDTLFRIKNKIQKLFGRK